MAAPSRSAIASITCATTRATSTGFSAKRACHGQHPHNPLRRLQSSSRSGRGAPQRQAARRRSRQHPVGSRRASARKLPDRPRSRGGSGAAVMVLLRFGALSECGPARRIESWPTKDPANRRRFSVVLVLRRVGACCPLCRKALLLQAALVRRSLRDRRELCNGCRPGSTARVPARWIQPR